MRLSHSKLNCILTDPMEYFLTYKEGITLQDNKKAFSIGSAMHWMIEHNTEDVQGYMDEEGDFQHVSDYSEEMTLARGMAHGYFNHQESIYNEILTDSETGEKFNIIEEYHELSLEAPLKSYKFDEPHQFNGIIDLLLLTDKGFIIIDYKTYTQKPDFYTYIDQVYRYIFLLKHNFPDVPIVRIGIVGIKKTGIRQRKNELKDAFLSRIYMEYETNDDLIMVFMYNKKDLDDKLIEEYVKGLSGMADLAQTIEDNKMFFMNYGNQIHGKYGEGTYAKIYNHVADCYVLYKIRDSILDENTNTVVDKVFKTKKKKQIAEDGTESFVDETFEAYATRPCVPLDMLAISEPDKIMNKYSKFKEKADEVFSTNPKDKVTLFDAIKSEFDVDDNLMEEYWIMFNTEKEDAKEN